ncbi:hypothetical protein HY993_04690 [Candidatus Micrarchaeota archaeon]|nr:hypothetical protein [Candidatus Micrarchaeota archaeon]
MNYFIWYNNMPATPASKDNKVKDAKKDAGVAQSNFSVTIPTIAFDITPEFTRKAMLLIVVFIMFVFSMFLYAKTSFNVKDAFDFGRIALHASKFWSISFILFAVSYSLCLGILAYFGKGLSKPQAAVAAVPVLIAAGLTTAIAPGYDLEFLAFGLTAAAVALVATNLPDFNWKRLWGELSKAMYVLMVLAFLVVVIKVSANTDSYYNSVISNSVEIVPPLLENAAPNLQTQVIGLCADAVDSVAITRAQIEASLDKGAVTDLLKKQDPQFASYSQSTQTALVDAYYASTVDQTLAMGTQVKKQLVTQLKSLRKEDLPPINVTQMLTPKMIKSELEKIPQTKFVKDALPFILGFAAFAIVNILAKLFKALAVVFAIAVAKFLD